MRAARSVAPRASSSGLVMGQMTADEKRLPRIDTSVALIKESEGQGFTVYAIGAANQRRRGDSIRKCPGRRREAKPRSCSSPADGASGGWTVNDSMAWRGNHYDKSAEGGGSDLGGPPGGGESGRSRRPEGRQACPLGRGTETCYSFWLPAGSPRYDRPPCAAVGAKEGRRRDPGTRAAGYTMFPARWGA